MNGCGSNGLCWQLNKLINFCFKLAVTARETQSILKILIGLLRNVKKEYSTSHLVGKEAEKVKSLI